MAIIVNNAGIRRAKALIASGNIDNESPWSFSAGDGNSILGDPPDWNAYGKWFIAIDDGENKETKGRYKYPFGKDGKIYRRAVIAAKSRAAQQNQNDIADTADELLQAIDKKEERTVKREKRSVEIRELNGEEGTFTAYACTWDTIDSYNSMFQRGAFKKTIEERVNRGLVKVLDDHGALIGRVTDAVEDDHGLRCTCKLTLEVQRAAEVRALMIDGAMNTMSFGFDSIKENRDQRGQRVITEVRLWEVSPVRFASNEDTSVIDVRSVDFDETIRQNELMCRGRMIWNSLRETLDDIAWNLNGQEAISAVDVAWTNAHAAYVEWVSEIIQSQAEQRSVLRDNPLSNAMIAEFRGKTIEQIAASSPLSADEVRSLIRGKILPLEVRNRLVEFNPNIAKAHSEVRAKAAEALFSEVRAGGFSQAEETRLRALMNVRENHQGGSELRAALDNLLRQINGK